MTRERFPLPTQERLQELFAYEPETGVVTAKVAKSHRGGYEVGDAVGYHDAFGYLKVTIDHRLYALHRVIWKLVTGEEPPAYLDHANRKKDDNRWANLRAADAVLNNANKGPSSTNFIGAKGVHVDRYSGRWHAAITVRGEHSELGVFDTREAAIEAYNSAAEAAFGEFACAETGPCRHFETVLTLCDDQLLDAFATAVRRLWSYQMKPSTPENVKADLLDIGLDISTELARIDPQRFGHMRTREHRS